MLQQHPRPQFPAVNSRLILEDEYRVKIHLLDGRFFFLCLSVVHTAKSCGLAALRGWQNLPRGGFLGILEAPDGIPGLPVPDDVLQPDCSVRLEPAQIYSTPAFCRMRSSCPDTHFRCNTIEFVCAVNNGKHCCRVSDSTLSFECFP